MKQLLWSGLLYLVGVAALLLTKPSLMFTQEGHWKEFGIGRWAVGGTKAIWGYDIDQYEREREDRARAGIIDFPGYGPDQVPELAGRQLDANGYPIHGAEAGYDFTQTGEDDA